MIVKEIFYSLQGEGFNAGRPAVFIRFAGCNLNCPFCDTDWKGGKQMNAEEIVTEAQAQAKAAFSLPELVVLTGGEPTLQVAEDLVARLHTKFKEIAIETNGTRPIPKGIDFVTLSPKEDFCAKEKVVLPVADEVKVVYDIEHNPQKWLLRVRATDYYLQPCDTGDEAKNKCIVEDCVKYIKGNPVWRLSLQTQKILQIQ